MDKIESADEHSYPPGTLPLTNTTKTPHTDINNGLFKPTQHGLSGPLSPVEISVQPQQKETWIDLVEESETVG